MSEKGNNEVSKTIFSIVDKIVEDSGYPNNTVKGHAAFAYGLVIGTLTMLSKEWESKNNDD